MGVSPWITTAELIADHPGVSYADGAAERAIILASEILYDLTGRRWPGVQHDVVRPLCQHGSSRWYVCGYPGRELSLPGFPLVEIAADAEADPPVEASPAVLIDGVAFTAFRVVDRARLARTDGRSWPCQSVRDFDDPAQLQVSYSWGRTPTAGGKAAASSFAHQLALALTPALAKDCALPQRVTSVSRQGVSVTLDPSTYLEKGRVGLPDVDRWIMALRWGDAHAGAAVITPGARPRMQRPSPIV